MTNTPPPKSPRPKVLCAVGTRPEVIKLAPVIHELRRRGQSDVRVLATAQHRDLLDQIVGFFEIDPDIDLDLMQHDQALADLTSRMLAALDNVLAEERPDMVLAQGDTTTVMIAALCAYYRRIPFGHVEAGLRTHDRYSPFPEEMNRVLTGDLATLNFAPTAAARENLLGEGVPADDIVVTGNTVVNALMWSIGRELPVVFDDIGQRPLILVTAHRRESFGRPLEEICESLLALTQLRDVEIVYPVHPNPSVRGPVESKLGGRKNIRLVAPLDYPTFVATMQRSTLILTDSGGIQEEAPSLGKPVLVLREKTERQEGVDAGAARLVGPHQDRIIESVLQLLDDKAAYAAMARVANPYGDGKAAGRIVDALEEAWT